MGQSLSTRWDMVYDDLPERYIAWDPGIIPGFLKDSIIGIPRGRALDACCGAGAASIYLAMAGFNVDGIDISPQAISIARRRAVQQQVPVKFSKKDILSLQAKGRYDLIFDRACLHSMPDALKPSYAQVLHRALKTGGRYLLMAFSESSSQDQAMSLKKIVSLYSSWFSIGSISQPGIHSCEMSGTCMHAISMTRIR